MRNKRLNFFVLILRFDLNFFTLFLANDKIFVENLAQNDLFDLVVASNLVDFQLLLDVLCKAIANMIREKSVDEIRKMFNLKSDFEPEDQEELDRESAWIEKYN